MFVCTFFRKKSNTTKTIAEHFKLERRKRSNRSFLIFIIFSSSIYVSFLYLWIYLLRRRHPSCSSLTLSLVPLFPSWLRISIFHFLPVFKMALSQRDMFCSSPESSPRIESSLPTSLSYTYLWVVPFDWDENVEKPFDIYQIALFSPSELKDIWISGELDSRSRQKKLKFSAVPGKTVSLFAKVEKCESFIYKNT